MLCGIALQVSNVVFLQVLSMLDTAPQSEMAGIKSSHGEILPSLTTAVKVGI